MKKILKAVSICTLVISLTLAGCSKKENQSKIESTTSNTTKETVQTDKESQENMILTDEKPESKVETRVKESVLKETSNETSSKSTEVAVFDLANYLKENFPINGVRYEVRELSFLKEFNRQDYIVVMIAESQEKDDIITNLFKNGGQIILEEEAGTRELFEVARKIIDLPKEISSIHIDNVHWQSLNKEEDFLIIQDYNLDSIK